MYFIIFIWNNYNIIIIKLVSLNFIGNIANKIFQSRSKINVYFIGHVFI